MSSPAPYDAFLLLSFGGPEGPDDVMPFLENVTRGRNVPRPRLEQVAEQYHLFGGVSPINAINRTLLGKLQRALPENGVDLPTYWGNRNWHPYLADTVRQMQRDGVRRALAFATSAYSSYSSCRQYLEDIDRARAVVGAEAPQIDKIRPYWNHPRFIAAVAEHAREAAAAFDAPPRLVFTAHSIPMGMATGCDYEAQLREASSLVASELNAAAEWDLVYQSRSGPPTQPWLEPDVNDHIEDLARRGVTDVLLIPIGFVADHMEVLYDLDTQAAETARRTGVRLARAKTAGAAPGFVAMICDLVSERIEGRAPAFVGTLGARPTPCPADCCSYVPNHGASRKPAGEPPAA